MHKALRITLVVIAWLGALLMLLSSIPGLQEAFQPPPKVTFRQQPLNFYGGAPIYFAVFIFGTLLVLIGGLATKTRYFWIFLVVLPPAYVIEVLGSLRNMHYYYEKPGNFLEYTIYLLPAIISVIGGLFILYLSRKSSLQAKRLKE